MLKVILFSAEWCMPCKVFKPAFEALAQENPDIDFSRVDVDTNSEKAMQYGVRGVPTLIIEKDGEVVERKTGSLTKNVAQALLEKQNV